MIYEYQCSKCLFTQEIMIAPQTLDIYCSKCRVKLNKLISTTGKPRLHGVGCYKPTTIRWD